MTAPKRVQLRRTKGWRKPEGAVVVARPSRWGNPFDWRSYPSVTFPLGAEEWVGVSAESRRRSAVVDFEALVKGWVGGPAYPSLDEIRSELAGRDLACWCPLDQPCHADVLLAVANDVPGAGL